MIVRAQFLGKGRNIMKPVKIFLVAACGMFLTPLAYGQTPTTIYVDGGNISTAPYYGFYADAGLTQSLNIYSGGPDSLLTGQSYTFIKSATSHPFYVGDNGYNQQSSNLIAFSGDGSAASGIGGVGQSFTLSFNGFNPSVDTLTYYCTAHSNMVGTLQVVPEPSTVALFTIGGIAAAAIYRRRSLSRRDQAACEDTSTPRV